MTKEATEEARKAAERMAMRKRRAERRKKRELEEKRRRDHAIKHVEVCDAWYAKPLYEGEYNEDGERPILHHPHAWFILVTLNNGQRYFTLDDAPFYAIITGRDDDDMKRCLAQGLRKWNKDTRKLEEEFSQLFRIGPNKATDLDGLIAKARMEERAYFLVAEHGGNYPKKFNPDPEHWGRWPYSEYGTEAWEAEQQDVAMRERQDDMARPWAGMGW